MAYSGTAISPRQAIDGAYEALKEMVADAEKPRLEEIVLTDDNKWLVTLSFASPSLPEEDDPLAEMLNLSMKKVHRRQARVFEIDATTGHFRGMKLPRNA